MTSNFWLSSHYNHWIVNRITLEQSREDDLKYATHEQLALLEIFFANVITKLGKRLSARQQVIATAIVYFKRFYLKNSYCDTEPFLVLATCLYVASKIEEVPAHFKQVVLDARALLSEEYGFKTFPSDQHKLAEMEFYLLEDLDFHLIVYHPYRTLIQLCGETALQGVGHTLEEGETIDHGGFWGTGKGALQLEEEALHQVWYIINDTYRSHFCLLYPPHLIAVAAIFLVLVLHPQTRTKLEKSNPTPRYQTRSKQPCESQQSPVEFLASLNVSYSTVSAIAQEIISMWTLWAQHPENGESESDVSPKAPAPDKESMDVANLMALLDHMQKQRQIEMSHPATGEPPVFRAFERRPGERRQAPEA